MTSFGSNLTDLGNAVLNQQAQQNQAQQFAQSLALQQQEQQRLQDAANLEAALNVIALDEERRQADLNDALTRFQVNTQDNQFGRDLGLRGRQLDARVSDNAADRALREQLGLSDLSIKSAQVANQGKALTLDNMNAREKNRLLGREIESRERIASDRNQTERDLLQSEIDFNKGLMQGSAGNRNGFGLFGNDPQAYSRGYVSAQAAANQANALLKEGVPVSRIQSQVRDIGMAEIDPTTKQWVPSPKIFGAPMQAAGAGNRAAPVFQQSLSPSSAGVSAKDVINPVPILTIRKDGTMVSGIAAPRR